MAQKHVETAKLQHSIAEQSANEIKVNSSQVLLNQWTKNGGSVDEFDRLTQKVAMGDSAAMAEYQNFVIQQGGYVYGQTDIDAKYNAQQHK